MGNAAGFSRPYRALFAVILLTATPLAASECPDITAIAPDDTPRPFVQMRTLPSLPKPLESTGVLMAREDSFVWQVCEPFDIRTVIDGDGVTQSIEGGAPTSPGSAAMQSAIRKISIGEIFRGRFDRLESVFDIDTARSGASGDSWHTTLTPKSGTMSGVIAHIGISGCEAIERVEITYRDGGVDDITVGAPMSGAERADCGAK